MDSNHRPHDYQSCACLLYTSIGAGSLGLAAIERIINHPQLKHLPFYLETPNELPGYAAEIALLRGLYKE